MSYISWNENKYGRNVGDCTVRAISTALDQDWDTTYWGICIEGALQANMPSSNQVWGKYLEKRGFRRSSPPYDMTVREFSRKYRHGTYLLALAAHVVAVIDGDIIDTWNSGNEIVLYFWKRG